MKKYSGERKYTTYVHAVIVFNLAPKATNFEGKRVAYPVAELIQL
jgi:hypothetical protein